jgi:hypothetical protein
MKESVAEYVGNRVLVCSNHFPPQLSKPVDTTSRSEANASWPTEARRLYNRRFLQMCSHYLVDPVACSPASGWEKGQVENQVGLVRERFFTPRLRFKTLDELNDWLLDKCIAYAKAHRHPELPEQTVWEVFEAERPKLVPYAGRFCCRRCRAHRCP